MEEVVVTPQINKYRNRTFIEHSLWGKTNKPNMHLGEWAFWDVSKSSWMNSFVPSDEEEEEEDEEEEPLSNGGHSWGRLEAREIVDKKNYVQLKWVHLLV